MHVLPFGAQITEKLFQLVQQGNVDESWEARGYLPSFTLAREGAGPWRWLLAWIWFPKRDAEPETVFIVDGMPFYIPSDVRGRLHGHVLDWDDEMGVVSHAI